MDTGELQERIERSTRTGTPRSDATFFKFAGALLTLLMVMSAVPAIAESSDTTGARPVSLSIADVNIPDARLPAKCKFIKEERFVSVQAHMLYEMAGAPEATRVLKPPVHKSFQTIQCGKDAGTVYYYEYDDVGDVLSARSFVDGLIWGGGAPTEMHPDLILAQDNVLVVVSSRTPETLRKLVRIEDMPRVKLTPLAGEQDVGAGVLVTFPPSLKVVSSTMPHGATNFRAYGAGLKIGITGIPTGQPRAQPDFVASTVDNAARQYAETSRVFPAAQTSNAPKYNAARSTQCSDGGKYAVFPDASFACMTILVISADQMVLVVSVGTDSLELDDYKAAMAALLAAH
jgi:hypothetical protein